MQILVHLEEFCNGYLVTGNVSKTFSNQLHCVKSVRILSYSGPYFPAFGLNTEKYSVSLHIQSECGKVLRRVTPNTDTDAF